jgi:hypothetical protein
MPSSVRPEDIPATHRERINKIQRMIQANQAHGPVYEALVAAAYGTQKRNLLSHVSAFRDPAIAAAVAAADAAASAADLAAATAASSQHDADMEDAEEDEEEEEEDEEEEEEDEVEEEEDEVEEEEEDSSPTANESPEANDDELILGGL